MAEPRRYVVGLALQDRPVVVVGAGAQAIGHVAALRDAHARVTVVATEAVAAIADLADRGVVAWRHRGYSPADLEGARLVVAASGDPAVDAQVAKDAEDAGLLCVTADAPSADGLVDAPGAAGEVVLVGGGPGDPGLLTVAGLEALRAADVVVCDRLAPLAALTGLKDGAEVVDVAKIPRGEFTAQERINEILVEHARAGRRVVRLKGGDNFVFGRGGEELQACAAAGIATRVIPGISSALAGPALGGIPVTHRGLNQGFTVVSGHVPPDDERCTVDYGHLARAGTDLVLLMAVANLPAIAAALVAGGMPADTPAAMVADASLPSQHVVRATLTTLADAAAAEGLRAPAITVVGAVAAFDPLA
ncbi:uroporphyrinogen-III C-methyltransferase [Solicola sp. PLA-1-18]|uniref:uroporphyrinogen-III C-methyltransferase n=1 Tax=Solicola sp. PLA-1-18 TaxID=3380532 RepID=UPI003B76D31F